MTDHGLVCYPYASFANAQLSLLKVAALYFDKLVPPDPVGTSWGTIGADQAARDALRLLKEARIPEIVTPAAALATSEVPIANDIGRDMGDPEFLGRCDAQRRATGKQRWMLSLAKVPQDRQTEQTRRRLTGDFTRDVTREPGQYRERVGGNPSGYYEYAESGQAYERSFPASSGCSTGATAREVPREWTALFIEDLNYRRERHHEKTEDEP